MMRILPNFTVYKHIYIYIFVLTWSAWLCGNNIFIRNARENSKTRNTILTRRELLGISINNQIFTKFLFLAISTHYEKHIRELCIKCKQFFLNMPFVDQVFNLLYHLLKNKGFLSIDFKVCFILKMLDYTYRYP